MRDKEVARNRRREREAKYGHTYKAVEDKEGCCVYCGEPSKGGRDHVPPLAYVQRFEHMPRLLYPCCQLCNEKLYAYPATCLQDRADFLICALRREWLYIRGGMPRKWSGEAVAIKGIAVRNRVLAHTFRALCCCRTCETKRNEAAKPRSVIPYAGKETGQGTKPEWDYYDEGGVTGC